MRLAATCLLGLVLLCTTVIYASQDLQDPYGRTTTNGFVDPRLINVGPRVHPTPWHAEDLQARLNRVRDEDDMFEAGLWQAAPIYDGDADAALASLQATVQHPPRHAGPIAASLPEGHPEFNHEAPPLHPLDSTSDCAPPWPGYPACEDGIHNLRTEYEAEPKKFPDLDGGACTFQKRLSRKEEGALCPDPDWLAIDSKLPQPGPDGVTEFLVYRVESTQSEWHQHLGDTNAGNAGGVLGYTHTEVLNIHPGNCYRRLHVNVIVIFKARVRNPGGHFTPFWPYDGGHCGVCDKYFKREGFVVGAQNQGNNPRHAYSSGIWYSFPSRGECAEPDGSHDCTYSFRLWKVVPLDRMIRLREYTGFNSSTEWCKVEYAQKSNCVEEPNVFPFWQAVCDPRMCRIREQRLYNMVHNDDEVKPLPAPPRHARFEFHCMMVGADFKMYIFPYPISWLGKVREALQDVLNHAFGIMTRDDEKIGYAEGHADVTIDAIQPQYERSFQMEWMEWRLNFHSRRSFYAGVHFFQQDNDKLNETIWKATRATGFWQIWMTEWKTMYTDYCTDPSPCVHGSCEDDPDVVAMQEAGGDGTRNGDPFVMTKMCVCDEGWVGDFCDVEKGKEDPHHPVGGHETETPSGDGADTGYLFLVLLFLVGGAVGLYYWQQHYGASMEWVQGIGVVRTIPSTIYERVSQVQVNLPERPAWLGGEAPAAATDEESRGIVSGGLQGYNSGATLGSMMPGGRGKKKKKKQKGASAPRKVNDDMFFG